MQDLIAKFNIENVLLSGGLFYNVKLNNFIIKQVPGLVSVIPVTGDQGAAIGFYQKYVGDFNFTDLCYGKRKLDKEQFTKRNKNKTENIIHFDAKDKSDFIKFVSTEVAKGNIVNLVQGRLEYGPRALCNTSTLMLPLKKNADFNNYLNKRNDFMPVCPVLIEDNMDFFFGNELSDRVIGSDRFMVLTYDFKDNSLMDKYDGIMHKYPMENKYSGRPQKIVKGELMYDILLEIEKLSDYKAIINTSYNYHGTPINFSMKNAIDTFNLQLERIKNRKDTDTFLVFYNG
jgi:carbamoyltransferase